jgi:hypothetical protein
MQALSTPRSAARLISSVAVALAVDILLHVAGPALSYPFPSVVYTHKALFFPLVIAALSALFLLGAGLTGRWRDRFQGSPLHRASRFALLLGGTIAVGAPDFALLTGGVLSIEIYTGLVDATAVFLFFWLLYRGTTSTPKQVAPEAQSCKASGLWAGLIVALVFVAGRLATFLAIGFGPFGDAPIFGLGTAALLGLWFGATYVWLPWANRGAAAPGAVSYVLSFFAPVWIMNAFFMPLFVKVDLMALAVVVIVDIAAVALGLTAFRWIHDRRSNRETTLLTASASGRPQPSSANGG